MLDPLILHQKKLNHDMLLRNAIFIIFLGTALLNLRTPDRDYFLAHAPYIMFLLQVGLPFLILPYMKLNIHKTYNVIKIIMIVLFLLMLYSFLSSLWSEFPELVLKRTLIIYLPLFLIGFLTWCDPEPLLTYVKVARGIVFFVITLSVIGILLYFFGSLNSQVQSFYIGPITIAQRVYGDTPILRISSLLGNPNTLAMWLLLSLPLTLYLIHIRKIGRFLGEAGFFIQFLALLLTFSRTGIGATLIALISYYLLAPNIARKLKRIFLVALITIVVFCSIFILGVVQFDTKRFSFDLNDRDKAWSLIIHEFWENPLFGTGFGVSNEVILNPSGINVSSPHNAYLHTLVEIGLLGYCLFFLIWFIPLVYYISKFRHVGDKEKRYTLDVCASLLIAFCVHQFFESHILRYSFHNLYWYYLIFLLVHPSLYETTNRHIATR